MPGRREGPHVTLALLILPCFAGQVPAGGGRGWVQESWNNIPSAQRADREGGGYSVCYMSRSCLFAHINWLYLLWLLF